MAIVVPFLVEAGVAAAGYTAATATMAAVATSVVFQVTGVNDKINKAASKVFGEDLVQIANIAGAVYGAYNGGFSLDPAKEFMGIGNAAASGAEAATAMNVPTGIEAGNAFEAQMAGMGRSPTSINLSDMATSIDAGTTAPGIGNDLTATAEPVGSSLTQKTNIITGTTDGIGTNAKPLTSGVEATNSSTPLASSANATASNAAGVQATAGQQSATDRLLGINRSTPSATAANAAAPQSNVFTKLWDKMGDKTMAGLIQGAASGYSSAQQNRLAEERARVNPSTVRGYTYRPTV